MEPSAFSEYKRLCTSRVLPKGPFFLRPALGASSKLLLYFIPIWLVLGGLVYVVARLLGKKLTFFRAVFDWWVTLAVIIPILLNGLATL
jgi:hypothetical protein